MVSKIDTASSLNNLKLFDYLLMEPKSHNNSSDSVKADGRNKPAVHVCGNCNRPFNCKSTEVPRKLLCSCTQEIFHDNQSATPTYLSHRYYCCEFCYDQDLGFLEPLDDDDAAEDETNVFYP